jgi:hypothetical protein
VGRLHGEDDEPGGGHQQQCVDGPGVAVQGQRCGPGSAGGN